MYVFIVYFVTAVVLFAIVTYFWSGVQPERFPKSTSITMPILAISGILTLILWVGSVNPPATIGT
ncbi:MAG: hypothetical protein WCN88_02540 [Candidatus Falkowbacteria bacterium]